MHRQNSKSVHYDSGPNMTPLVDVVMVILIFLMLAGSFGTAEHFMASSLPIHARGIPQVNADPRWHPPVVVDVMVSPAGVAQVPGFATRESDPNIVEKQLETKLADFRSANHATSDIELVLHPMASTKWATIAPLYDAAVRAKFEKVSFAQTQ